MNKHRLIGLGAIVLIALTGHSLAADQSYHINGGQLLGFCKDTISMMNGSKDYNVSKSSWCIGFVQGAVTSHRFYSSYYTLKDYMAKNPGVKQLPDAELEKKVADFQVYCVPPAVNLGQLVHDVVKFLENNPKYQQEQASIVIARALREAYPCQ